MGRRCLLSDKVTKRIMEGIEQGLTYDMCAKYAGVSPSAFYTWLRKGREGKEKKFIDFVLALEQAEANGAVYHLENIKKNSKNDWKASAWILERRHNYTRYNTIQSEMKEPSKPVTEPKEILSNQIQNLQTAAEKALAMGSFQAYARLISQRITAVVQLNELQKQDGDSLENASDEQILHDISSMILSLPPVLRQKLEGQITQYSNPKIYPLKQR